MSGSTAGVGGSTAGMQGAAGATDDGEPTWSGIYTFTFRTCRIDTCHGGGLASMDFSSKDAAWESLINHEADPPNACGKLGKLRVVPEQPEESLLYLKLFSSRPPCGSQMPPGGQLPDTQIERVRAWIEMGAKND